MVAHIYRGVLTGSDRYTTLWDVTALRRIYEETYSCYGARKLWAEINREGSFGHVARCTVERLMAAEGLPKGCAVSGDGRKDRQPATPTPASAPSIWWNGTSP